MNRLILISPIEVPALNQFFLVRKRQKLRRRLKPGLHQRCPPPLAEANNVF